MFCGSLVQEKKTKIIATLGPATEDPLVLESMIAAGTDVIRLNASHNADPKIIQARVATIRTISAKLEKPVGIFLDLQGPKIRVGQFKEGKAELKTGKTFTLVSDSIEGNDQACSTSYPGLISDVSVGDHVYLDDGNIRLVVAEKNKKSVSCTILQGGVLSNFKGINLPFTKLRISAFTEKDQKDFHLAVDNKLDYVALSFVSDAQDILHFRKNLDAIGGKEIKIIAKIELQLAIDHIASIIEVTDAVMVARGDLGVEIGVEKVPEAQKSIIRLANQAMKPVIVATQMLESMIQKRNATRAEVSDVANAIYDGCDAVMLSGETAVGCDPANAVATMKAICLATDLDMIRIKEDTGFRLPAFLQKSLSVSFASAADQISRDNNAKALMVFTSSGNTPLVSSKLNPTLPIVGVTDDERVLTRMALYRGVTPLLISKKFVNIARWTDMIQLAIKDAKKKGYILEGDTLVITAGIPLGLSGGTNSIRLVTV